jgi:hypothetical protein
LYQRATQVAIQKAEEERKSLHGLPARDGGDVFGYLGIQPV